MRHRLTRADWKRITALACVLFLVCTQAIASGLAEHARVEHYTLAPGATTSDLYARWLGTRLSLFERRSPYTDEATRSFERGVFGRERQDESIARTGDQSFLYPLYFVFLVSPLAMLPFALAQPLAAVLCAFALVVATLCWAYMLGWPRSQRGRWLLSVAVLLTSPAINIVALQQPTALSVLLIAAAGVALHRARYVSAGIFWGLATVKPQLIIIPTLVLAIWVCQDLRRRWVFPATALSTFAALLGASFAWQPSWPEEYATQMGRYREILPQVASGGPLTLTSPDPGHVIAALIVSGLAVLVVTSRLEGLIWGLALACAATAAVVPGGGQYHAIWLLPAGMMLLRNGIVVNAIPSRLASRFLLLFCILTGLIITAGLVVAVAGGGMQVWLIALYASYRVLPVLVLVTLAVQVLTHAASRLPIRRVNVVTYAD